MMCLRFARNYLLAKYQRKRIKISSEKGDAYCCTEMPGACEEEWTPTRIGASPDAESYCCVDIPFLKPLAAGANLGACIIAGDNGSLGIDDHHWQISLESNG